MAVTTQKSPEYAAEKSSPHIQTLEISALGLQILQFNFVQSGAGDIASTMSLRRLPGGLIYFFPLLSRITWEAFGAARTLDIGHGAYTGLDLVTVVADDNLFDDDVDVSAAGTAFLGSDYGTTPANNGGFKEFNSIDGVDIFATVAGGTIPDTTNLTGYLVIARP